MKLTLKATDERLKEELGSWYWGDDNQNETVKAALLAIREDAIRLFMEQLELTIYWTEGEDLTVLMGTENGDFFSEQKVSLASIVDDHLSEPDSLGWAEQAEDMVKALCLQAELLQRRIDNIKRRELRDKKRDTGITN